MFTLSEAFAKALVLRNQPAITKKGLAALLYRALHRQRQVTHILLWAIANTLELSMHIYLKGGALMALAFASPRQIADVDFTVPDVAPEALSARLRSTLAAVDRAPALLGYPDIDCRIQRRRHRHRDALFADADVPAIEARLGSARRGTGEMDRLDRGQATDSLPLDISFREPVVGAMELGLLDTPGHIRTCDKVEVIAEKLRAPARFWPLGPLSIRLRPTGAPQNHVLQKCALLVLNGELLHGHLRSASHKQGLIARLGSRREFAPRGGNQGRLCAWTGSAKEPG